MIVSTGVLARVATILGKDEDALTYSGKNALYHELLVDNFWDESRQMFDDFYVDTDGNKQFDGHTGYLNFWPLFTGAIDYTDGDKFETTVTKLLDPATGLWTDYGISSLSSSDPYYKLGDDYWTSPIWMNINFLITRTLYNFSTDTRLDSTLRSKINTGYQSLRTNLINMIVSDYTETG